MTCSHGSSTSMNAVPNTSRARTRRAGARAQHEQRQHRHGEWQQERRGGTARRPARRRLRRREPPAAGPNLRTSSSQTVTDPLPRDRPQPSEPRDAKRARTLRTDHASAGCGGRGRCLLGAGLLFVCHPSQSRRPPGTAAHPGSWYPTRSRGHLDVSTRRRPARWNSEKTVGAGGKCQPPLTSGFARKSQVSGGSADARNSRCIFLPVRRVASRHAALVQERSAGRRHHHDARRGRRDERLLEHPRGRLRQVRAAPSDHDRPGTRGSASGCRRATTSAVTSSTSPARTGATELHVGVRREQPLVTVGADAHLGGDVAEQAERVGAVDEVAGVVGVGVGHVAAVASPSVPAAGRDRSQDRSGIGHEAASSVVAAPAVRRVTSCSVR